MTIQKNLEAISKAMLKQASRIDKLAEAIGKLEQSPSKPRTVKRAPKAKPVTKRAKPKAAPKKSTQPTDSEKVLKILKRSKKGVSVKALTNKTGFNQKKISNIIYKGTKSGNIKKVERGIYTAV
jgi:uncharacterized membrane protein YqiK